MTHRTKCTMGCDMATEFKLPDLGENIESVDVVNVLVAVGDVIQPEQNVLEVETGKAIVELPCPHGGQITAIHVKVGDKLAVGAPILSVEAASGAAAAVAPVAAPKPAPAPARTPPPAPKPAPVAKAPQAAPPPPSRAAEPKAESPAPRKSASPVAPASPAVRRMARELGIDLDQVEGTGPGDRITQEDLTAYVRQLTAGAATSAVSPVLAAVRLPDFSKWGEVERRPLRGVRKKSAENLTITWQTVPHVTQFDNADVTELEAARRKFVANRKARAKRQADHGEAVDSVPPLTMTVLVMKAVVKALRQMPQFNSSLDATAGELILKSYYHIGVAVDTEHGLIVPVIRDVDKKNVIDLAFEVDEIARRARDRKVDIEELRGGTFTISNLGGIGGTGFTPILNYPEVAILGLSRSRQESVIIDGRPEIRTLMPLCLSYDHRVIDGADGVRFTRLLAEILADPFALLLEG